MKKLIQIQTELKAPKNQYNNFGKYKYRNAEDILEAVKPLLSKYECGLKLSDKIKQKGSMVFVEATARFTDGEQVETAKAQAGIDPNRKGMDISQSFGSSSSYARKYALNGLFLIDDTKDADFTNTHESKYNEKDEQDLKATLKDYLDKNELKNDSKEILENWKSKLPESVIKGMVNNRVKELR